MTVAVNLREILMLSKVLERGSWRPTNAEFAKGLDIEEMIAPRFQGLAPQQNAGDAKARDTWRESAPRRTERVQGRKDRREDQRETRVDRKEDGRVTRVDTRGDGRDKRGMAKVKEGKVFRR